VLEPLSERTRSLTAFLRQVYVGVFFNSLLHSFYDGLETNFSGLIAFNERTHCRFSLAFNVDRSAFFHKRFKLRHDLLSRNESVRYSGIKRVNILLTDI